MEETILKSHDKTTLKNMALDKGLSRRGFNGRNVSRMRKQDFIEFILSSNRDATASLEDEVFSMFQELLMDDSFHPIIHIMGTLSGLDNIHVFTPNVSGCDKPLERTPNEEDEKLPNLLIKDLVKTECISDCKCETCQENSKIQEENLKAKSSIQDLEGKITCVICQSNVRNMVLSPCNHLATCISCIKNPLMKKTCPLCRKSYTDAIRIFF